METDNSEKCLLFGRGKELLAQYAEFCKDTSLWQDLQYKDAFRQASVAAYAVSKESGIPVQVLLAKAWEENFKFLYGYKTTFSFMLKSVLKFLSENSSSYLSEKEILAAGTSLLSHYSEPLKRTE